MSKSSIIMLQSTQGQLNVVGDKVRADGWYGHTDGLHTVAIYLNNFTGRIIFEASIASAPNDDDWFPIELAPNQTYLSFPKNPSMPTGTSGDTGTIGMNIIGGFTWLRARVDRSYIPTLTDNDALYDTQGYVDRILLNN